MAGDHSPEAVLAHLRQHARGDDLARLVHTAAFAAADERRPSLADGIAEAADRAGISASDAETEYGNVVRALERGGAEAAGSATRLLLSALLARGVALTPPPADGEAEARVVESLVWLAANTSVDGLLALDAALGADADRLWRAVAGLVRRVDAGQALLVGRPGALIGAAALRESSSSTAHAEAAALADEVRDPLVRSLLLASGSGASAGAPSGGASAAGELVTAPRSPVALVLLGVTGILAAMHVARLIGRFALRYRRPAELLVTRSGITLRARTELLGRTLKEREIHFPLEALARATREVRYPRLALYAGLVALAVGSYFGLSLFVEGARAASPEIIGFGLLLAIVGVVLDYVLENLKSAAGGRCLVVIVPRRGAAVAIADVDPGVADRALGLLK
jgi:hypothetical protein